MHLYNLDRPDLKDAPFVPAMPAALAQAGPRKMLFAVISHRTFCCIIRSNPSSPWSIS